MFKDVPRQQFFDAVDGMVGNALQHIAQIGFGIEAVELGRAEQAIEDCRPLAAASEPANR